MRTGHPDGKDPYFLYAASNVGSFLALLSYPVLVEPVLSLRTQTLLWTGGYWVLFALIGACALPAAALPRRRAGGSASEATPAPSWRAIGRWMFLAAVPSGLLVAVTAHISTDVAAAPLLWVIPLSLYLLTWVLVFQRRPLLPHRWMLFLQPFAIVGLVVAVDDQHHELSHARSLGAPARVLHHRDGVPRRACAAAAAGRASDDILRRAVRGRHDRRIVRRPDRSLRVLLDRGISDPHRARGALPAAPADANGTEATSCSGSSPRLWAQRSWCPA